MTFAYVGRSPNCKNRAVPAFGTEQRNRTRISARRTKTGSDRTPSRARRRGKRRSRAQRDASTGFHGSQARFARRDVGPSGSDAFPDEADQRPTRVNLLPEPSPAPAGGSEL